MVKITKKNLFLAFCTPFRIAGRTFIWFCEQPLTSFANSVDSGLKRIAYSLSVFGKNPVAGTRMTVDVIGIALLKPFVSFFHLVINPIHKYYERDLEEVRRRATEEPIERVSLGTALLLILLFFALYLIIEMMYGWLAP